MKDQPLWARISGYLVVAVFGALVFIIGCVLLVKILTWLVGL